jgi:hypothetical protein
MSSFSFAEKNSDLLSLFQSANKLYEQGKYEEAKNMYHNILNAGFQSGAVYYNMGNTYFKLGLLGQTILYYEKAKRLNPRDPELRFNYNYVQSLLQDKAEEAKHGWAMRNLEKISEVFSFGRWLGIIIMLWFILIVTFEVKILFPVLKNAINYINMSVLIFLIMGIICGIVNYNVYSSPSAIILPKEVIVRYGPGESEVEAFMIHEGTKVEVLKEYEEWCQVRFSDEKAGWLPKDAIGMI